MPDTASIGHNRGPAIEDLKAAVDGLPERLQHEFADIRKRTDELLDAFTTVPETLTSEESAKLVSDIIAQITAHVKHADARREELNAPVLFANRAINGLAARDCFDALDPTQKGAPPGIKQKLLARLTKYQQAKADAERRRREEEERKAREAALAAERARQEEERKVREAQEAERRRREAAEAEARRKADDEARAIQNEKDMAEALRREEARRVRAEKERQEAGARERQRLADLKRAQDEAAVRAAEAVKAAEAAAAKNSQLHKTRGDYGSMASLRTDWVARIENLSAIDLNAIRDFISEEAIQKALNAYVKIHKDKRPLNGVAFREVAASVVRG